MKNLIQTQAKRYKYNSGYDKCNVFIGYSERENMNLKKGVYNNQMDSDSVKVQVGKVRCR